MFSCAFCCFGEHSGVNDGRSAAVSEEIKKSGKTPI